MTALGEREAEARRIARANMHPIIEASEDWTFFTLDDPVTEDGQTVHTHFEWVEDREVESGQMYGRFEGFVS